MTSYILLVLASRMTHRDPLEPLTPRHCPPVDSPTPSCGPPPRMPPSPMPRNPRQGLTTLATLAAVLLLAVLTLTLQTRTQIDLRLLARLTQDLEIQTAKDSLTDRLRTPLAAALTGDPSAALKLDGTPLVLTEAGRDWEVRIQDVEGQVDLYLASPEILALLPLDPAVTAATRTRELAALPPGARFPVLPMTAARFGVDPAIALGHITQSSTTGMLRLRSAPEALRGNNLLPGPREGEQVMTVTISIRPVSIPAIQP